MLHRLIHQIHKHAPVFIGAALFCAGVSCKRGKTPDWQFPAATTTNAHSAELAPVDSTKGEGLRFLSYNLKNWLEMERLGANGMALSSKPESEKQAVVAMIVAQQPDVVGVCEIGTADDLADLRHRLKTAGLDLPYFVHHGGTDPERHLGLLSRFPILKTAEAEKTDYQIAGKTYGIHRGILDATLNAGGKTYRFLGVHLKSRRDVDGADQAQMRLEEARLLRRHVDQILNRDPATNLVVYGDFNDTRDSMALKTVIGENHSATYLAALPLKDSHSQSWTYFWSVPDVYSRIDFIFTSSALKAEDSHIADDPNWLKASDHRPIVAIFR